MKSSCKFFFIAIIAVLYASSVYAIDARTLWTKLNFPDPNFMQTRQLALQNPSLLEEIMFYSDMNGDTSGARFNCLRILKECGEKGIITSAHFFDVCFRLYNQMPSIAHPSRLNDSKNYVKGTVANFMNQVTFPISKQFSGFSTLLNSMSTAGLIRNNGIINSLNQKIANAKKSLEKKNNNAKKTAINHIEAAVHELNAQRGNQITEDAHKILTQYCQNLITKIQNTN
jgi:hypothetical protein